LRRNQVMSEDTTTPTARPLEEPEPTGDARLDALARLFSIVDRLRAPDGCPWDREQTVASMAPSLIEEAFEAVEAIEDGDDRGVVEETGDLLMVIALIARIASEEGRFDIASAARAVGDKLVRRHPHVFGDVSVSGADQAVVNWERIKQAERRDAEADASALAGVPKALPALQRAHRIGQKAVSAGFCWADASGALAKVREELEELAQAMESEDEGRVREELGDLLLATALLGNYLGQDAELATREAVRRFELRFRRMEEAVGDLRAAPLAELLAAWDAAKERP